MEAEVAVFSVILEQKGITLTSICHHFKGIKRDEIRAVLQQLEHSGQIGTQRSKYYPVSRYIMVFDKATEELVKEISLSNLDAESLTAAFSCSENDSRFFEVYDLNASNCAFFRKRFGIRFDFKRFHYQLAASLDQPA